MQNSFFEGEFKRYSYTLQQMRQNLKICTTAPYSPESNDMAEAFVKTLKRDYAYVADLSSANKVLEQLPAWFEDYNNAPHKGLKMLSPSE